MYIFGSKNDEDKVTREEGEVQSNLFPVIFFISRIKLIFYIF